MRRLLTVLFLAVPLSAANFVDRAFDFRVTRDVAYANGLTLDLYEPTGADAPNLRPAFMAIHGGGWTRGTKGNENIVELCEELAKRGYVCASISYRLNGDLGDAVDDCALAIRWIERNAARHRIDPARIAVGGSSAGAVNSVYLAYERRDPRVRAVLSWAGGLFGKEKILRAGGPPLFVVHGTADSAVPVDEARTMISRARETKIVHEAYICEGIGHNAPLDRRPRGISLFDRLAHFLYRNMNLAPLATTKPKQLAPWVSDGKAVDCPH